jgi:hypothetical protein
VTTVEICLTSIPPATLEKLSKLIVRLGDANSNEILAACGAIVATLRTSGHDLHDVSKLVRTAGNVRLSMGQVLGAMQANLRDAERQHAERRRTRRAAAKAMAEADRIRKSVELWSKKVTMLRTQNWFDAEQRQFVAQISAQLAGGEPLTAEQRNRVLSLLMKSQIREQKRTSAETESPAPKAGSHWAW